MGALLAGIGLVQFIGLAISGAGVIVPEIDRVAARHLEQPKCVVTYVIIRTDRRQKPQEPSGF